MTTGTAPLRLAVIGAEHPHIFSMVEPLLAAGAVAVAHDVGHGLWPDLYRGWRPESEERPAASILDDPDVDLILTAAVPCERAAIAVAALSRGKSVLADKPGATTLADLDAVVDASRTSLGRWWVLFSERLEHPSVLACTRRAANGEFGRVVHVGGSGPHDKSVDVRPEWFWDPDRSGGILVDLASHQIDQFLAVTGADPATLRVLDAAVGNVATPEHPGFQDIGQLVISGGGAVGVHRVDYLSPAGLGAWGDPRLVVVGTEATAEVRSVIDPGGRVGGELLIVTDAHGTTVTTEHPPATWAIDLIADLADGGERLMPPDHPVAATRVSIEAQRRASPWPSPR